MSEIKRVFLIVLDSFGVGELPDAKDYGDEGSNTLRSVANSAKFCAPALQKLGLFEIDGIKDKLLPHGGFFSDSKKTLENDEKDGALSQPFPVGSYGRLAEKSKGKDTTTGHWELAGLISSQPFPTYPYGFPDEIIGEFERRTGRGTLCNLPYSGTEVIEEYGAEHLKTGKLIVYTSADSVFQIAAHEDVVPVEELYRYCRIARELLTGKNAVGRVIARPFAGAPKEEKGGEGFYRTARRHDFSLAPTGDTLLDVLKKSGLDTIGVGKISDIFAGRGLTENLGVNADNEDGMKKTQACLTTDFRGLCFVNLVDFDMLYGHRNDADGYAAAISRFDRWLLEFLPRLRETDLLMITADHGCDPDTSSTDHSREYVPLLAFGKKIRSVNLGTRSSFSDVAATVLDVFHLNSDKIAGKSFLSDIIKD